MRFNPGCGCCGCCGCASRPESYTIVHPSWTIATGCSEAETTINQELPCVYGEDISSVGVTLIAMSCNATHWLLRIVIATFAGPRDDVTYISDRASWDCLGSNDFDFDHFDENTLGCTWPATLTINPV